MAKIYTYLSTSGDNDWILRVEAETKKEADARAITAVKKRFRNGELKAFLGCRMTPLVTWSLNND